MNTDYVKDYNDLLLRIANKYDINTAQADRLIKDWLLTEEAVELLETDIEKQLEG